MGCVQSRTDDLDPSGRRHKARNPLVKRLSNDGLPVQGKGESEEVQLPNPLTLNEQNEDVPDYETHDPAEEAKNREKTQCWIDLVEANREHFASYPPRPVSPSSVVGDDEESRDRSFASLPSGASSRRKFSQTQDESFQADVSIDDVNSS